MSEESVPHMPLVPLETDMLLPDLARTVDVRRIQKMQPDAPLPDLNMSETLVWGEDCASESLNLLVFPRLKGSSDTSTSDI